MSKDNVKCVIIQNLSFQTSPEISQQCTWHLLFLITSYRSSRSSKQLLCNYFQHLQHHFLTLLGCSILSWCHWLSWYILLHPMCQYGCKNISSDPDCTFPRKCTSSVDFTDPSLNGTNRGQNKTIMEYGDPIHFIFFADNGAGSGAKAILTYLINCILFH